MFVSLKACN